MSIEDLIEGCKAEAGQIRRYDPDPHYVGYFFRSYLGLVERAYGAILGEADRDFGLFATRGGVEGLRERSLAKNDSAAARFVSWYEEKVRGEHRDHYPALMQEVRRFYGSRGRLPGIRVMLRARDRYKDDVFQEIRAGLSGGALRSREELQVEAGRQAPVFLEVINSKRTENGEPAVSRDGVVASAFFEGFDGFEIGYAAEVYVRVVRRIADDSRKRIRELTVRQ